MATVAMKGGILKRTTMTAFPMPISVPSAMAISVQRSTPIHSLDVPIMPMQLVSTINAVPNTAEKPALAPVDTSPSP